MQPIRKSFEALNGLGTVLHVAITKPYLALAELRLTHEHEQKERAKSMAELTRSGHVYVISNIGSFGERVYKIGMTRRLEPLDRVKELGDASVPFEFDVHALIHTEDAPALERAFHTHFSEHRVNLLNQRKEFFEVSLDQIEAFVASRGMSTQVTKLAEAREYRQTLALRAERASGTTSGREPAAFPTALLAEGSGATGSKPPATRRERASVGA